MKNNVLHQLQIEQHFVQVKGDQLILT